MRPTFWWLVTFSDKGQLVILGKYDTELEANKVGLTRLKGRSFQVFALNTSDQARATKIIKYKVLEETNSLESALKRARHSI